MRLLTLLLCLLTLPASREAKVEVEPPVADRRFPQFPTSSQCHGRCIDINAELVYLRICRYEFGYTASRPLGQWIDEMERFSVTLQFVAVINDPCTAEERAQEYAAKLADRIGYEAFLSGFSF